MSLACAMAMGVLNPEEWPVVTEVAVQRYAIDPRATDRRCECRRTIRRVRIMGQVVTPRHQRAAGRVRVLDRLSDRLTLESLSLQGESANGLSAHPRLVAGNGQYLVFESVTPNLLPDGKPRGVVQVFLRDRFAGTTGPLSPGGPTGRLPTAGARTRTSTTMEG